MMNRLNPDLLARYANKTVKYAEATTTDGDILQRRWLLVDLDPKRPSGISSTDEELEAAGQMAQDVKDHLCGELHWLEPVEALSGNGWHLLFPIDLPNDSASTELVKKTLLGLESKFNTGTSGVGVDTSVFNAARITKLYGTTARKGSDVPRRPHRQSRIMCVPDNLELAS